MPPRFHKHQELLPLVAVDQGKSSYSAYLLPQPSIITIDNITIVKVHWDLAGYDGWVPAQSVTLDEFGGRRSSRVSKSDKEKEQATLEALSVLITVVNDERSKESDKVKQERDKPPKSNNQPPSFPAVFARDGKHLYPAHLLPEKAATHGGVNMVRIFWITSGYATWVPAKHVTITEQAGRSKRGATQNQFLSDETNEAQTLESLSLLLSLVNDNDNTTDDCERLSIRPEELASSNDVCDETPETSQTSPSAVRRNEAALLKDSETFETEPVFDNNGNRPRKVPQILSPNRESARRKPKTRMKTPVKASAGNLWKRKPVTSKSLMKPKKFKSIVRKEDKPSSNDAGNQSKDCATAGGQTGKRQKYDELGPKWSKIAQAVPGRSVQACRAQFNRTSVEQPKQPSVGCIDKRAPDKIWTPEDDRTLLEMRAKHGPDWNKITQFVAGSSYHGCRARFRRLTNGKHAKMLQVPPKKKQGDWNAKEDSILQQKHAVYGNKWSQIAKSLPHRSGDACRRRFIKLYPVRIASKRGLPKNKVKPKMSRRTRLTEQDRRMLRAYVPTRYVLKGNKG